MAMRSRSAAVATDCCASAPALAGAVAQPPRARMVTAVAAASNSFLYISCLRCGVVLWMPRAQGLTGARAAGRRIFGYRLTEGRACR